MAAGRALARVSQPLQIVWLTLLTIVMAARYFDVYTHRPLSPDNTQPANAWFGWADQAAYYLSVRGWATWDLSPAHHVYPAGYALLVTPFYWLSPAEPFALPDLLCWDCGDVALRGPGRPLAWTRARGAGAGRNGPSP